ncbi:MAG TPA: M20/M25/M40 family metallo-hydrolase [Armatimonadota bacterium]|jgi:acetylornithine deacetylase
MPSLSAALTNNLPAAQDFLLALLRYPSTPGQEAEAMDLVYRSFADLAPTVEKVPIPVDLPSDPDYSTPLPDLTYAGHHNVRVHLPGGGGKSLLFNTHLDVVPASEGQERPFDPRVKDGVIYARGACDAKGQVATLYLLLRALREVGQPLPGDVILNLVVEEEVGGNGTLAAVRRGEQADGVIVLEPTNFRILPSVRGAVWFRVECRGRAGHSGQAGQTVSALKMAVRVMEILEGYHDRLLAGSRGLQFFDDFPNPMPITFGRLHAGDWPATAPSRATVEGVLGLLPNKTHAQVAAEMRQAICDEGDEFLRENFELSFMYRHDSHVLDPAHPLVTGLAATCAELQVPTEITAMTASCDSWFYNNQLGIPTLVFGPGDLKFAHANQEQIEIDALRRAAEVLGVFLQKWGASG